MLFVRIDDVLLLVDHRVEVDTRIVARRRMVEVFRGLLHVKDTVLDVNLAVENTVHDGTESQTPRIICNNVKINRLVPVTMSTKTQALR